eukprot:3938590-Rhodomonas_salina.6
MESPAGKSAQSPLQKRGKEISSPPPPRSAHRHQEGASSFLSQAEGGHKSKRHQRRWCAVLADRAHAPKHVQPCESSCAVA